MLSFAFLVIICIHSFIQYDKKMYLVGRSLFDYKELPLGISTDNVCCSFIIERTKTVKSLYEFNFVYNGFEFFGSGFCCVYNQDDYKLPYDKRKKYSIEDILEYYYDKNNLFILCQDETGKQIWVKPFDDNGDIIFLRIPYLERSRVKNLKRVVTKKHYEYTTRIF